MSGSAKRVVWASLVAAVLVATPPAVEAGGFSTVELDTPPPAAIEPGEAWDARFTVLAHGRVPSGGGRPVVRIAPVDGDERRVIDAVPASAEGSYRARVVFPEVGRWRIEIAEHDLAALAGHSLGEIAVGGATDRGAAQDARVRAAALALALGLLAGGLAWVATSRPARAPARRGADVAV